MNTTVAFCATPTSRIRSNSRFDAHVPVVVAYLAIGVGRLADPVKIAILGNQTVRAAAGSVAPQPVLRLVDIAAVVLQIVEQLIASDDVAFFFKPHVAGRGDLFVRKRQMQPIGKHRGTALAKAYAASGIQFLVLVTTDAVSVEKQRGRIIAAQRIRNQLRLHAQFQAGLLGVRVGRDRQDQHQDCRCETGTMHAGC